MRNPERKRAGPQPTTKPRRVWVKCKRGHVLRSPAAICQTCAVLDEREIEYQRAFEATRPVFPNGVVPIVHEMRVVSSGRIIRHPMCLPGQTPCSVRAKRRRRR